MLDALGYSDFDDIEHGSSQASGTFPDYILRAGHDRVIAVEAKRLGASLGPKEAAQLVSYCYLTGDRITLADWRLFPTLVRFDPVYYLHFRCNGRRIVDCPNLWGYTRELYQQSGIADTVAMDEIREHYYTTHDSLNPKRIIPRGPLDLDFTAPHGRG